MNAWMTRWLAIGGSCLLLVSAIVPAARAAPAQQSSPEILVANNQKYGPILVDSQQHTLYILTAETNTVIKCADKCLTFWPPLTVPAADAKPMAAAGVTGDLGTVARPASNPRTLSSEKSARSSIRRWAKRWKLCWTIRLRCRTRTSGLHMGIFLFYRAMSKTRSAGSTMRAISTLSTSSSSRSVRPLKKNSPPGSRPSLAR